eukprot:TRINITY_DN487_c0_g1_i3.p1 TRINITY_DN487_c0_g1~~TRINITY_DN487_c0_g1_i3.p1  ORF type:complete len:1165 (-),score=258.69 TRINITY_DN487_c0_g1_i3:238-3732(-)
MLLGTVKKGGGVKKAPPPAAPKPLNLPSQKKENAGYDPKVALVPSGGSGWNGADGPPPTHPSAESVDEPEPIPLSTPGPAAPVADAPTSVSPAKIMAWGGRGMTKADSIDAPPPPQVVPSRPTEDPRFSKPAGRWGGSALGAATLNRRTSGGEQWPTLAPKEEEEDSSATPAASSASSTNGLLQERINTARDDSWADVDDEMSYDDADNLFNDAETKKPTTESELCPEEVRALHIMRMEAAERKREEAEILRLAAAADKAATDAAEAEAAVAAEDAARAANEVEARSQEPEAAKSESAPARSEPPTTEAVVESVPTPPAEEPVDIGAAMKSQAESARERRQREEEQRQAEQKARADERLRVLNEAAEKRKEEQRMKMEEEQRLNDARKSEEETQLRQKQEEEQRKFQTKNVWSAPERTNPSDASSWRQPRDTDSDPRERQEISPNSILKRDTSRRKLWVPESEREKPERPKAAEQVGLDRDRAAYDKKFNVSDQRNWRERADEAKEKERDEKKKRERERERERNPKKVVTVIAKSDKKPESKSQAKEECKADSRKKDTPQISLPAPLPKEGEESSDKPADQTPETDFKVPKASWSFNKLRKYCDQNGIKSWCEEQNIPIKMHDKDDLLSKYKLWAQAKAKGEIVDGEKAKRTRTTRRGKKDESGQKEEGSNADDVDEDGKKRRNVRGARKPRKDESLKSNPKDEKSLKGDDSKAEPKPESSKPGLVLDEQMGLQDIACGLRVGPDGGYAVVDSHEIVEDDSGFTTEVNKKEKKAQLREEALQKEKLARRERIKEAAKATKEAKAKAKADAAKSTDASAESKPPPVAPVYPTPISAEAPLPHPNQEASQKAAGPTKQAWGKATASEKTNFTSIMLDQKFKQTFPEHFEAPVPKEPVTAPAGSAPVGAERTFSGSDHDIWANSSAAPVASSAPFNAIPFDTGVGGSGFAAGNFNSGGPAGAQPYRGGFMNDGLMMHTLTPQIAQFTALPSFAASNRYNHAFSAAPGGDGWGGSGAAPATQAAAPYGQQISKQDPGGWADQEAVGSAHPDDPNVKHPGKGKGGSDRVNKKPRGSKARGGKDNKAKATSANPKSKDGPPAKAEQVNGQKSGRGGRQQRGKNNNTGKQSAGKAGDKASLPVDVAIPAKANNRRPARNAKKAAPPASDKN